MNLLEMLWINGKGARLRWTPVVSDPSQHYMKSPSFIYKWHNNISRDWLLSAWRDWSTFTNGTLNFNYQKKKGKMKKKKGLTFTLSKGSSIISWLWGTWDGPSHSRNCDQTNGYSGSFLEETVTIHSKKPKKKHHSGCNQHYVQNQSLRWDSISTDGKDIHSSVMAALMQKKVQYGL